MNLLAFDFADDQFDGIVSTFIFCVLDSESQLIPLNELHRVCEPGGTTRILENAISEGPFRCFIMKLWAPQVRFACGAGFDLNAEQYVQAAGLELVAR